MIHMSGASLLHQNLRDTGHCAPVAIRRMGYRYSIGPILQQLCGCAGKVLKISQCCFKEAASLLVH